MDGFLSIYGNRKISPSLDYDVERQKIKKTNEKSEAECTVWGALALTLRISRALGVAPLRIGARRSGWRIAVSSRACQCTYAVLVILNIIILTAAIADINEDVRESVRMRSQIPASIWIVDIVIVMLIASVGVMTAPGRMRSTIKNIDKINMLIYNLNNGRIPKRSSRKQILFLFFFLLFAFTMCATDYISFLYKTIIYDKNKVIITLYAFYYWEVVMLVLIEMQFVYIALHVNSATITVNEILEILLYKSNANTNFKLEDKSTLSIPMNSINGFIDKFGAVNKAQISVSHLRSTVIPHLINAYGTICAVVREVNEQNGLLIILLLASFLVHLVITPYYFITYLLSANTTLPILIMEISWCILHISKVIIIVEPGHRTQEEISKTHVLVGQLLRTKSLGDQMQADLETFYKNIQLNKISYLPLGLCTLCRPLVTSMLGVVTTYLVIIVQFQAIDKTI